MGVPGIPGRHPTHPRSARGAGAGDPRAAAGAAPPRLRAQEAAERDARLLWGISFGSLYPALRRLERSGAIEVVDGLDTTSPGGVPSMPATGSLKGEAAAAPPAPASRAGRAPHPQGLPDHPDRPGAIPDAAHRRRRRRRRAPLLPQARVLPLPRPRVARLVFLERRRTELADRLARAQRTRGPAVDRYTRSLLEHRNRSTERDLEWLDDLIASEDQTPEGGGPTSGPNAPEQEGATA